MICQNCKKKISELDEVCPNCGVNLEQYDSKEKNSKNNTVAIFLKVMAIVYVIGGVITASICGFTYFLVSIVAFSFSMALSEIIQKLENIENK